MSLLSPDKPFGFSAGFIPLYDEVRILLIGFWDVSYFLFFKEGCNLVCPMICAPARVILYCVLYELSYLLFAELYLAPPVCLPY